MSVDDAIARYPGEWILMAVTGSDMDGWPSQGYVLGHHPARRKMCQARSKLLATSDRPAGALYLFDGYPLLRTGEAVRQALEAARDTDAHDLVRWPRV
jgi:hypothetical protein